MADSSEHFSREELQCKHTGSCEMSEAFLQKLEDVRNKFGKPMKVTSAYRHESHPVEARKGSLSGYHVQGRAVDVAVRGEDAVELIQIALECGMGGIGVQQKGSSRFIHLDDRENRTIWSY